MLFVFPFYYITCDLEWASFLCIKRLSYSFLGLDQLLTFYPLHFQCPELPLWVPFRWTFWLVPSPLEIFIYSLKLLFSFMLINSPSLISSGLSNNISVTVLMVSYFFYNSIYIWLTYNISIFHFFMVLSFGGLFLILIIHFFIQYHMSVISETPGDNTITCFTVPVLNE